MPGFDAGCGATRESHVGYRRTCDRLSNLYQGASPRRVWRPQETIKMSETTRDSNGSGLKDGVSVTLIKDLKVKGAATTLKRGTLFTNIRLTGDPAEVECRAGKTKDLVLRTEFRKKA
jgi:protein PhnA